MISNNWHVENFSFALNELGSTAHGLPRAEALHRLKLHGPNEIAMRQRPSVFRRFLRQFHNILIYVLLVSALITVFLGQWVDSLVILGVVVLNAIFGFIQEDKAENAIDAIKNMLAPTANVIRDDRHFTVNARDLVVGDIVLIKSGDKVPADLRLMETKSLQIQESILTGESDVVNKNVDAVPVGAPLGDRFCMAYSGTAVTYGKGKGIVVATATATELGKISAMLGSVRTVATPLLRQMDSFGRWLTFVIFLLALLTFLIGIFLWDYSANQMFLSVVALAVAAIPEVLPPLLTIILAIGVTRMAKRNAIIRQLPAVETMGSVTTICTDKTGTLTRNEQTIRDIITAQEQYEVEDNREFIYSLSNAMKLSNGEELNAHGSLLLAITGAILCNDGSFFRDSEGAWVLRGDPVDRALLEIGVHTGIDLNFVQKNNPRLDLIPYESEHKFMATLHHLEEGAGGAIYIKGAPDQILTRCTFERIEGFDRLINVSYWQEKIDLFARQGYRIIAIARKKTLPEKVTLSFADVEHGLTLVAIFALIDAPRAEIAQAVEECFHARIKVKMITGDYAVTALTIASQVGIDSKTGVLTGNDLDAMSDEELANAVKMVNVYARTSPQHKLRLVKALQANGELVAMTGDGVNDAPALRRADIGVTMGHKGAELAKESADIVLADDNFATIVHAIEEGRVVYDNLKKVLLHVLPTNAAEGLVIVMAILFGVILPITPVQILWVNMITGVTMATSLGFEPAENNIMQRPPRNSKNSILSSLLIFRIFFVTLLLVASVFGIFIWQLKGGFELSVARTVAVNMLVLGEAIYLLNCRKLHSSVFNRHNFFDNPKFFLSLVATLLLQLIFTYVPTMQKFFGTAAIGGLDWLLIVLLASIVFAIVEMEKLISKKLRWLLW